MAAAHARVRQTARELEELRERAGTRDRDLDLLAFEIDEIETLDPSEEDREALMAERGRLREVDGLRAAAAAGSEAVAPDDPDAAGAATLLAEAERLADGVAGADPAMDALAERLRALRIEAEDLGVELRGYLEGLDADPERLHQIEERLEGYDRLERKHGGSVAAVLEHAERCRAERDRLADAEVATERAVAAAAEAEAERAALAGRAHQGAGEGGAEAGQARDRASSTRCRWRARRSRSCWSRATRWARRGPSGSTSCWRPTRACPPRRCARPRPAASCRA